jgi:hypothetical protein
VVFINLLVHAIINIVSKSCCEHSRQPHRLSIKVISRCQVRLPGKIPEAVFLVMCDPSMNEL